MLLLAGIFIYQQSQGQVIYQKFTPEIYRIVEEMNGDSIIYVNLDFNLNSQPDLRAKLSYHYCFLTPSADECFSCSLIPVSGSCELIFENNPCSIKAINDGDTIWGNDEFIAGGSIMLKQAVSLISCNNFSTYKYAGIKFFMADTVHYGWIKLSSDYYLAGPTAPYSYAEMYIQEIAFNTEPGCGLIAGDTISSICGITSYPERKAAVPKIFPNPASDYFTIKEVSPTSTIAIRDIFGRIIYTSIAKQNMAFISCETFPEGMYFVMVKEKNQTKIGKVLIKR